MDNKNFFRALFWALIVFLLWQWIAFQLWGPKKPPAGASASPPPTTATAPATQPAGVAKARTQPAAPHAELHPVGAETAETMTLGEIAGHKKSPYRMEVDLTNIGAAITRLRLSDYRQNVQTEDRYELLAPETEGEEQLDQPWRSVALEKIVVDGREVPFTDVKWHARKEEAAGAQIAHFTTSIAQGDQPVLELERTYRLPAQPFKTGRHDLFLSLAIRNLSNEPHEVIVTEHGAVGIAAEGRFHRDQTVYGATLHQGSVHLQTLTFGDVVAGKKNLVLYEREPGANPLLWWATANVYFTFTRCPINAEATPDSGWVALVEGADLDRVERTIEDVTTRTTTVPLTIPAGAEKVLHTAVYAGPKDRETFKNPANADYVKLDYMAQITHGYGSCAFNFLTDWMIVLLNWLESVFHNFGVAIFFLVIIVRVILHPITKKTQVNMVKMQQSMGSLQPKMEEIKKKYANDNKRIQEETMKLYREEGINPLTQMMGCLPMFLQMPIWIALYASLSNNVAMRCRGFVWWIKDLTAPDCLVPLQHAFHVPIFGWEIHCFNLLPILVGVTMFAQQKLMPKPKKTAQASSTSQAQQAEQMQKMMPYMSLLMIIIFYKFPSGLNLYIMTSSLFGALEQWYIRKHIHKQDLEGPRPKPHPTKPRSGPSLLERLQKKAEEAQKTSSHRGKKNR